MLHLRPVDAPRLYCQCHIFTKKTDERLLALQKVVAANIRSSGRAEEPEHGSRMRRNCGPAAGSELLGQSLVCDHRSLKCRNASWHHSSRWFDRSTLPRGRTKGAFVTVQSRSRTWCHVPADCQSPITLSWSARDAHFTTVTAAASPPLARRLADRISNESSDTKTRHRKASTLCRMFSDILQLF